MYTSSIFRCWLIFIFIFSIDETREKDSSSKSVHLLDDECKGHWQTPTTCSPEKFDCEYYVSWETAGKGDEMHFHIETNSTTTWTGVGFSDDQKMVS